MTLPPSGQPPPPHWVPQQQERPPRGGSRAKWALGGLGVLAVVVLTVVATLFVTRGNSGPPTPQASTSSRPSEHESDFVSANDHGPVNIITEDPTCAAWGPINDTLSAEQRKGWDKRNPSIPAVDWSADERAQFESVGQAMRAAADQTVALAKRTPHRVMRELYEQSIAYWKAYAQSLPTYQARDEHLALAANSAAGTIVWVCEAIKYGAAAAREPLVASSPPPLRFAPVDDPSSPSRLIEAPSAFCVDWTAMVTRFGEATQRWSDRTDPNIPATDWAPEQQELFTEVIPILQKNANETQQLGVQSGSPTISDFATLSSQYRRAYVQAIASYGPVDTYLNNAASEMLSMIDQACKAAGG